jgi:hypothetical protein
VGDLSGMDLVWGRGLKQPKGQGSRGKGAVCHTEMVPGRDQVVGIPVGYGSSWPT